VKAVAPVIGGGCIIYGMVGNEGRAELDEGLSSFQHAAQPNTEPLPGSLATNDDCAPALSASRSMGRRDR
jgi:hypothetical protein